MSALYPTLVFVEVDDEVKLFVNDDPHPALVVPLTRAANVFTYTLDNLKDGYNSIKLVATNSTGSAQLHVELEFNGKIKEIWKFGPSHTPSMFYNDTTTLKFEKGKILEVQGKDVQFKVPAKRTEARTVENPIVLWGEPEYIAEAGEKLSISAFGKISLHGDKIGSIGPKGYDDETSNQNLLVPTAARGALVARFMDPPQEKELAVFVVGDQYTFTTPGRGALFFAVNDTKNFYYDNSGEFTVSIRQ